MKSSNNKLRNTSPRTNSNKTAWLSTQFILRNLLCGLVCIMTTSAATANATEGSQEGVLKFIQPYTSVTPPGAKSAAGYVHIENTSHEADTLLGGSAAFAEKVEVHVISIENDVARMRKLDDGAPVAAGKALMLMPGKIHLMFMGLTQSLMEGEQHKVTLQFEKAGAVDVEFSVEKIGHKMTMDHSSMQHSDEEDAEMDSSTSKSKDADHSTSGHSD